MAVNTTEISSVYTALLSAMMAKYDAMWAANEIDAETYAQLVGQASSQLVQLSADLVQKQESLDADNLLKAKQLDIAGQELLAKTYEVTTLLVDQHTTNIKQQTLLDTQEEGEQYKVTFILPKELESITKDIDVKERGMLEQETMGVAQRVSMSKDDLIKDEQRIKVQEEIDLLETQDLNALEQLKVIYTDRVLKDKQAAKLGLDNVMKLSETARAGNANFVYTPSYEETV